MQRSPSAREICRCLSLADLDVLRDGLPRLLRAHAGLQALHDLEAALFEQVDAAAIRMADTALWPTPLSDDLRSRRTVLQESTVLAKHALTMSVPAIEEVLRDVADAHPEGRGRAVSPWRLAHAPEVSADLTDEDDALAAVVQVMAWHRHAAEDLFADLRRAVAQLDDAHWPRSAASVLAASGVATLRDQLGKAPCARPRGTRGVEVGRRARARASAPAWR